MPTLVEIRPSNTSQGQHRRKDGFGARYAEDLGSSPSECLVFYSFRCVLSSVLPLRSVGRSNFDKGRHNLTTLIQKSTYINESCYFV